MALMWILMLLYIPLILITGYVSSFIKNLTTARLDWLAIHHHNNCIFISDLMASGSFRKNAGYRCLAAFFNKDNRLCREWVQTKPDTMDCLLSGLVWYATCIV